MRGGRREKGKKKGRKEKLVKAFKSTEYRKQKLNIA